MQHFNCLASYAEYGRIFITLGFRSDGELGEPRLPKFLKGMEPTIQRKIVGMLHHTRRRFIHKLSFLRHFQ